MKFGFCKKQYIYLGFTMLSIGLAVTSHVFAQEQGGPEVIEERQDEVSGLPIEQKVILSERIQNRIINLARNMISRMESAAGRSEQIIRRVESRIEKLKGQGVDTKDAEMVLGYAEAELSEARTALSQLDSMTIAAVSSETPREAYKRVKDQFKIAGASIRDSYTHLRTMIGLLKEAVSGPQTNATGEDTET